MQITDRAVFFTQLHCFEVLKTVNARKSQNFEKVNTFNFSLYHVCPCSRSVLNCTDTNPVFNPQRRLAQQSHAGTSTD